MKFTKQNILLTIMALTILSGCYKTDLEEFKKVNSVTYSGEWAIPFVVKDITLKDSIPTIPGYTSVTMSDTASIQLPAANSSDTLNSIIDYVNLKINIDNTFPFSGVVQVYFADQNNVFIDSLLDASQRVIPLGNPELIKNMVVNITKARYITLSKESQKMYVFYNLTTNNISGLSNKHFKVSIGLDAKLDINIK
jgi:hypothetical protein